MPRVKMLPHELRNLGADAEARITAELRKPLTDRKPRAKRGTGATSRRKLAKLMPSFSPLSAKFAAMSPSGWVREFRFHPARRWRFDFAWPDLMLAVEIDGGVYSGGRHTRGKGFEADCEKLNASAVRGWTVLRYTAGMLRRPDALADLRAVLESKGGVR